MTDKQKDKDKEKFNNYVINLQKIFERHRCRVKILSIPIKI